MFDRSAFAVRGHRRQIAEPPAAAVALLITIISRLQSGCRMAPSSRPRRYDSALSGERRGCEDLSLGTAELAQSELRRILVEYTHINKRGFDSRRGWTIVSAGTRPSPSAKSANNSKEEQDESKTSGLTGCSSSASRRAKRSAAASSSRTPQNGEAQGGGGGRGRRRQARRRTASACR